MARAPRTLLERRVGVRGRARATYGARAGRSRHGDGSSPSLEPLSPRLARRHSAGARRKFFSALVTNLGLPWAVRLDPVASRLFAHRGGHHAQ